MIHDPDLRPYFLGIILHCFSNGSHRHLSLPDLIYLDLLPPYIHWNIYMYLASPPKKQHPFSKILGPKQTYSTTKYRESMINSVPHFALFLSSSCRSSSSSARTFHQGGFPKKNVAAVSPIKIKMDFDSLQATDANHIRLHCNRFLDSASTWWFFSAKKAKKLRKCCF